MIGQKSFSISAKEFLKGMTTAADTQDGGFSPETDAVNLTAYPGTVYPSSLPTDFSTNAAGNFIASCEDFAGYSTTPKNRFFVDDAKHYYSYDGSTLTNVKTDGSGNTYTDGITDMVPFVSKFYTTTTTDITEWDGAATLTTGWWTTTKGQAALNNKVPHPLIVYEKIMWIGDGNLLHKVTEGGTVTNGFLTLGSNETITALTIDPGSGNMLISVGVGQNEDDLIPKTSKVMFFDGFSNKPVKSVIVEDLVTSFLPNGGTIYCCYGQNFGYFNGSGLVFLRRLNIGLTNVPITSTGGLIWKHRMTNTGTTIHIAEGTKILNFGEVQANGQKVFYYSYKNQVNSNAISLIANVGNTSGTTSKKIGISFASSKFYIWDPNSTSSNNTQAFYTLKYQFDNPVMIRQIIIYYRDTLLSGQSFGTLSLYDENGALKRLGSFIGALPIANTEDSGFTRLKNLNYRVEELQMLFSVTRSIGIKRIVVRFDPADQ